MGEEESCAVFFPEMIAFSLALLYPASLVGTASIFIYHYTVSLGTSGVVWSRYIWIYHSEGLFFFFSSHHARAKSFNSGDQT